MNDLEESLNSDYKWYEYDFISALLRGYEKYREREQGRGNTSYTVLLPRIILLAVGKVKRQYPSFSARYIFYQLATHGFSMIQNEHNEKVKDIDMLRDPLEFAEIKPIQNFLCEMHTVVNGLRAPKRQNIISPLYVSTALADWSITLNVDRASLTRLCMYYSVATIELEEIKEKVKPIAEEEIASFRKHIIGLYALYKGFTYAETIMKEETGETHSL